MQVFGEFLRFIQRRVPARFDKAVRQVSIYEAAFLTPATTLDVIDTACVLARTYRLQLWDCVVCAASAEAGAKVL